MRNLQLLTSLRVSGVSGLSRVQAVSVDYDTGNIYCVTGTHIHLLDPNLSSVSTDNTLQKLLAGVPCGDQSRCQCWNWKTVDCLHNITLLWCKVSFSFRNRDWLEQTLMFNHYLILHNTRIIAHILYISYCQSMIYVSLYLLYAVTCSNIQCLHISLTGIVVVHQLSHVREFDS